VQKKDKVKVFGDNVPAFLDALKKNQSKFKQMPLGPVGKEIYRRWRGVIVFIGLSLRVKDDKWATAVENCIQTRNLKAFLISEEDEKLFQEIARKCNW
jgi:hypothetical protein